MSCLTLRGAITTRTFIGITGLSSSEILASDWVETIEAWTWPGISSSGAVIDATPDFIYQALPGYVYTRQSADLTTVDLVGPSGVIYSWVSSETTPYALAVDAAGDYWVVVAEDDGTASLDSSLWRVTPGGTATKEVPSTSATAGVSPGPIATTPDGAVWFSRFGTGSGLYRWNGGTDTAVTGVGVTVPIPRPDSSVWVLTGSGWRSVTAGLTVSGTSPCADLAPLGTVAVAWTDDWSIVAIHDLSGGDVFEVEAPAAAVGGSRWGSVGWPS